MESLIPTNRLPPLLAAPPKQPLVTTLHSTPWTSCRPPLDVLPIGDVVLFLIIVLMPIPLLHARHHNLGVIKSPNRSFFLLLPWLATSVSPPMLNPSPSHHHHKHSLFVASLDVPSHDGKDSSNLDRVRDFGPEVLALCRFLVIYVALMMSGRLFTKLKEQTNALGLLDKLTALTGMKKNIALLIGRQGSRRLWTRRSSEANKAECQPVVLEFHASFSDFKDVLDETTTMNILKRDT